MTGQVLDQQEPSGEQPPMAPPAGTPAANEHPRSGEAEQAKANVQIAISILEQALPLLGSDSEEGAVVLKALMGLSKNFSGKRSGDLAAAEHLQTMAGQPDAIKQQMMKELGASGGQPAPQPGM